MIRERVNAGIASARERGRPHGRPKTAALKIKKSVDLKAQEQNNSQIAKKLKISRGSVINQLRA